MSSAMAPVNGCRKIIPGDCSYWLDFEFPSAPEDLVSDKLHSYESRILLSSLHLATRSVTLVIDMFLQFSGVLIPCQLCWVSGLDMIP